LPGIGSWLALAIAREDFAAIGWAVGAMAVVILLYDQLVFRPAVAWADRFRFEQTASTERPRSWAYDLFRRTRLLPLLFAPVIGLGRLLLLLDLWCEGRMPIKSILIVTHNIEEAVLMCDRILVFSSNPGRVAAEIKVGLPQPRDRLDPAFRALVDDIYARMTARAPAVPINDDPFPGTGIAMVLPIVSTNALAGLIEEVDGAPFDGRASMADLADQLQLQIDELFPMADTLQLIRFAELTGAEIALTPAARRYAAADVDARKALFAQALMAHVPLAGHIRRILDERPAHVAPARRFRDELEDHMSPDYAAATLKAVTHWGRYAEIFAYHEDADQFSLDDPS
jgi:NitT/TauT family transport system ATP-binding protein